MSDRLKKRKRAESTHKVRVERRRHRTGSQNFEHQLLYSRKQAARLLGYKSIDPIIELEHQGRLTAIRPTGKASGQVFYRHQELTAIANR